MPEGICKLTGTYGKFVRSHIYPRSFSQLGKGERLAVVPLSASRPAQRSQTGIYDQNIVGVDGERILAELDDYAHKILIRNRNAFSIPWFPDGWAIEDNGRPVCFEVIGANPVLLKRFVLSILWRCAVSTRIEYESVNLGDHEEILRRIVSGKLQEIDNLFRTVITLLSDVAGISITPSRPRVGGARCWQMHLSDLCFTIDLEGAMDQPELDALALKSSNRIYILNAKFKSTKFGRQVMEKLQQHQVNFGDPWGRDR